MNVLPPLDAGNYCFKEAFIRLTWLQKKRHILLNARNCIVFWLSLCVFILFVYSLYSFRDCEPLYLLGLKASKATKSIVWATKSIVWATKSILWATKSIELMVKSKGER